VEASNLMIPGEVRDLELLRYADGSRLIVVARNGDGLQILRPLRLGVLQGRGSVAMP
jgi:hypothetical protein